MYNKKYFSKKNLSKQKIISKKKYTIGGNKKLESLLFKTNNTLNQKNSTSKPSTDKQTNNKIENVNLEINSSLKSYIDNEVQRRLTTIENEKKKIQNSRLEKEKILNENSIIKDQTENINKSENDLDQNNNNLNKKPEDNNSDIEFCNVTYQKQNKDDLLEKAKNDFKKCLSDEDLSKAKCENLLEKQINEYLKSLNELEKNNNKLIKWPGTPDTEPSVPNNPNFYTILDDYFSGKTGDCNFTIPLSENITKDSCSFGGGINKKHTNKIRIKKNISQKIKNIQLGGKINFYRHQVLVSKYLNPKTPYRGILAYHGLGSGKTLLSAITISNFIKEDPERVICYIAPPGLVGNFYKDLYKLDNEVLFPPEIKSQLDFIDISLTEEYQGMGLTPFKIRSLVNEKLDRIKEREVKKRILVMSYESWGNRLRGSTAWDTPVNLPDIVNTRSNKQGIGGIISNANKKVKKMDTAEDPLFNNTLVIMDEVQELISSKNKKVIPHMNWIQQAVRHAKDIKILFMTATPIKNHPYELAILLNLLKPSNSTTRFPEVFEKDPKMAGLTIVNHEKTKNEFNNLFVLKKEDVEEVKNINIFRKNIIGLISYYSIERNITKFARKIEMDPVTVDMMPKQLNEWRIVRNKEMEACESKNEKISCNSNASKKCKSSRQTSLNINSRKDKIKQSVKNNKLSDDANKILYACDNIEKLSEIGKQFVYSEFNINGIYTLKLELRKRGWIEYGFGKGDGYQNWISIESLFSSNSYKNRIKAGMDDKWVEKADYTDEEKSQKGLSGGGIWANPDNPLEKRKAFITLGDNTDSKYKEEISKGLFNRFKNINGDYINAMIVNSKYAEGVSLFAVRQVHILEPPTSLSLRDQIIGRAIRSCSHKGLTFPDKWNVSVYEYYSTGLNLGFYKPSRLLDKESTDDIDYKNLTDVEKETIQDIKNYENNEEKGDIGNFDSNNNNSSENTNNNSSENINNNSSENQQIQQLDQEGGNFEIKPNININKGSVSLGINLSKKRTKLSSKLGKKWCIEYSDPETCNSHEYCQWNDYINPDDSNQKPKCMELPTDFVIEKMSDRADHLKQQFLRLLKESAIDCTVFKNANEAGLKCYRPSKGEDESSIKDLEDKYNINLKSCQNLDEDNCNQNKKCIWKKDNKDNEKCQLIKIDSNECIKYDNQINCIKNTWCIWNEQNEKCSTYFLPELKNMENGIYFFYNKNKSNQIFEIKDVTYDIIKSLIIKELDEINNIKDSNKLIEKLNIIAKIFSNYTKIKDDFKNKLISIISSIKKNEPEIWTLKINSLYKSILDQIINQNNYKGNIGDSFLDGNETIDQLNNYNKLKNIKENIDFRKIYLSGYLNNYSEVLNLKKFKEEGNTHLDFVLKLQVGKNKIENKNGLDYLIVSFNIPKLSIDLDDIANISKIITNFEYHSIKIEISFVINYGKLDKIDIVYNVDKDLVINPNNSDMKNLTTKYEFRENNIEKNNILINK